MEPDTERMLTLEMLEGKESRGGRVALVELLAERDDEVGTWAPAMLLAASVSICAIAWVVVVVVAGFGEWVCWRGGCP
jgi:hypothetical protein